MKQLIPSFLMISISSFDGAVKPASRYDFFMASFTTRRKLSTCVFLIFMLVKGFVYCVHFSFLRLLAASFLTAGEPICKRGIMGAAFG